MIFEQYIKYTYEGKENILKTSAMEMLFVMNLNWSFIQFEYELFSKLIKIHIKEINL